MAMNKINTDIPLSREEIYYWNKSEIVNDFESLEKTEKYNALKDKVYQQQLNRLYSDSPWDDLGNRKR